MFIIYINDTNKYLKSKILKFADNTKVLNSVSTQNDINKLTSDLVLLGDWSSDWLMLFNVDKCKIMHLGKNNPLVSYSLCGRTVDNVVEKKTWGHY